MVFDMEKGHEPKVYGEYCYRTSVSAIHSQDLVKLLLPCYDAIEKKKMALPRAP